jgi:PRC-barrel domain protein
MKTYLATASLLALLAAAPVQAQTPPPSETKPGVTQTTPPADTTKPATPPSATPTTPPSATAPAPTTDAAKKTDMPKSASAAGGDWRASKLIGQTIRNAANESIGDINDLIVDTSGKVSAVIVGVGGFLGIGEKNVSLPFEKLSFSRDANNAIMVTASATKDSLQSAPEYQFPDERGGARPTTGGGTSR